MQVLRQILKVNNNKIYIELPADFKANEVEVIVLPVVERIKKMKQKISEKFRGCLSKKTAEEMQKQIKKMREEWERDI